MNLETKIQKSIQLAVSLAKTLIFRNETGNYWTGKVIHKAGNQVTLTDARMIRCGLMTGSADLIGVTPVVITADMVGKKIGVFTSIEVKTPTGRMSKEQVSWEKAILNAGGYAGVARNDKEALNIINGAKND